MVKVGLENLTKRFEDVVAVDDINIDIEEGEFLSLLGPSGCGKTTTLRMIAGLEDVTEGSIKFDADDVTHIPPKNRKIAMVFQEYALYPHMTAFENIAFPLRNLDLDVSEDEIEKRVREVASTMHIEELLDREPKELSGGQRQRIALGRAIVRDPAVFLLDEPLANLDAKLRIEMRSELKQLQSELGVTTIYVTHDQVEAMTMADRIAVMKDGSIEQFSPPNELYSKPENTWIATFIGNPGMNVIDCSLVKKDGARALDAGDFEIGIEKELADLIEGEYGSTEINIGIRPSKLSYQKNQPRTDENSIKGKVGVLEPIGNATIVNVGVGDRTIKLKTDVEPDIDQGDDVFLTFDMRSVFYFDKDGDLITSAEDVLE